MLLKDLVTVGKNAKYLRTVLGSSHCTNPKHRAEFSEAEYVANTKISIPRLIKELAVGQGLGFGEPPQMFTYGNKGLSSERWIFVNGIATDREIAVLNAKCLYEVFKQPINVVYNPTYGVIADLAECVFERTFNQTCLASIRLTTEVLSGLQEGLKVKVIAHSQGGIIASRMLDQLNHTKNVSVRNLEVYTFGSAADEDVPGVFQEHFLNEGDFVSRIGLFSVETAGSKYVRDSAGHLLNRDFLEHFAGGYFCNKSSYLYRLMRRLP